MTKGGWGGFAILLSLLAACAVEPPEPSAAATSKPQDVVIPWVTLTGGWLAPAELTSPSPRAAPPPARIQFQFPVGVAARGNDVFIVDGGLKQILRYDRARDSLTALAPFPGMGAEQSVGLYVAADQSLYVADPGGRQVLLYDRSGRLKQTFRDDANLGRPVAVAVPETRGEVLVADSLYNQIVVFSNLGRPLGLLGGRNRPPYQSVAGMMFGPDGLYVLDRQGQQVVVLGPAGEFRYAFGEDSLIHPRAFAVDRANRVFVADDADNRIKVFFAGERVATVGGSGAAPARFNQAAALAVDENLLYVADSLNGRVQILLVTPESMRKKNP